ncbi:hypothetical protein HPB51_024035 [Rhipicephalus microplus]|uniref:Uncharacterized protein n=1 Tax=Rhipicephalus microplus TaxID=6941 RepID=A0A9J6ED65_RHIMP|nr:hypothetical protein HPB51_024035 [Rhipicephalus microplus]
MTSPPHLRPATLLMVHSMERLLRGLQLAIRLTPHLTTMGQDPSILTWNGVLQTMVLPRSTTSVSEACPGGARLHEDRVAERRRLEAVEACHFHLLRGTAVRLLCLATKSNPCKDLVLGQRRGETSAPAVVAEGLENKNWLEKPWTKLRIYWPRPLAQRHPLTRRSHVRATWPCSDHASILNVHVDRACSSPSRVMCDPWLDGALCTRSPI